MLRTFAVGLLLAAVTPASAAPPPPVLWDHPGYDAEDSYFNPHESAITAATVGRLTKRWSANLRQVDESCTGFSAPVLGAARVFATPTLGPARDFATPMLGAARVFATPMLGAARVFATPTLGPARVFATDAEGVTAYGASAGDMIWRFTWDHADDNRTPQMAVAGGLLILANGGCNSMSDPDGRLTALDASWGRPRWTLHLENPVDSVVVDKNVVLVSGASPSDQDEVAAYRVRDGHLLWRKPGHASSGVSADGLVPLIKTNGYGQPAGRTIAVTITTGATRWSRPLALQALAASPSADRFYATDPSGALVALNASTGATLWTTPGGDTPLLATDGPHLYSAVGSKISARNATTGRVLWSRELPAKAVQPVLAAGLLYTGGPVLNALTGAPAGPSFPGWAVPAGGHLYQVDGPHLTAYTLRCVSC